MPSTLITLRVPTALLRRLDETTALLARRAAGVRLTRSAVLLSLLERGIADVEAEIGDERPHGSSRKR